MFLHSYFSLKYGVLSPAQLVDWAAENLYPKVVLCDINSSSSALSFVRDALEKGLAPVVGIDFRNGMKPCYTILAQNNAGFQEVNHFLSRHLHLHEAFPARPPKLLHCHVIYNQNQAPTDLASNEWVGIHFSELTRLQFKPSSQESKKLIAFNCMSFRNKKDFNTHRLLRAIDNNTLLSKLAPSEQTREDEKLLDFENWKKLYENHSFLIENTFKLLDSCGIHFTFGEQAEHQNKHFFTESKEKDLSFLKQCLAQNINKRYPEITKQITDRIAKELDIIAQKDYLSYFLIAWDITSFARSKSYFYVGRGSGANSIVAYILGITDVDPLELDLYFERFINLYRKNPPDFDIDFSWKERDEVIAYIFRHYPNSALLCTYNTFQYKAAVREIGKVFGLPKPEIDHLTKGRFKHQELDHLSQLVLKYSQCINGIPAHLSIHAGGIIISEKPTSWFSATFMPQKGFPTTQFSMLEAEDVGLYKFDILSQRGLSKIHDCLTLIGENQEPIPSSIIHDMTRLKKDEKIKHLLRYAQATGCFYVESPAMRMLLTKLQVDDYLGLVAASSIIRPGVAQSGMMREYILRHRNVEKRKEAHPILQKIMPETYGIMVYQEDVIKVAHYFAGLSLAEADVLRRGMSGKFRSREEFQQVQTKFFDNCTRIGYPENIIRDIWRQIESFAGYAFSKGHSASYAVESYQSLYLKAHYPLEYMTATLNNFGGYYRTEVYVHEARKLGAEILPPSINEGEYLCTIKGKKLILGFVLVQGIEQKIIDEIFSERTKNGKFKHVEDLFKRIYIPIEQLSLLIRIGALNDFGESRKSLLWKAHFYHNTNKEKVKVPLLFEQEVTYFNLPTLEEFPFENSFEQIELLGFPLCNPFDLLQDKLPQHIVSRNFISYEQQQVCTYGYLITLKQSTTSTGKIMFFGTFFDQEGELIDSVHFPNSGNNHRFLGKGIYQLEGVVTSEFGHYSLEVQTMEKLAFMEDVRFSEV